MSRFIQIHILTHYPASNPNRDDLGRPKTAVIGGVQRQRISSQSLKRALRTSPAFVEALQGKMGERTQRLGEVVFNHLIEAGADDAKAREIARQVAEVFGKAKAEKDKHPMQIEQLAFVSPQEKARALEIAKRLLAGEKLPSDKELAKEILLAADGAVDIAMFGRMLANTPDYNRDAAVQIAHAITTNKVDIEDDYYAAVDDLKRTDEDAGSGFIGEAGFGSGVYYIYANIDTALLLENLEGDEALTRKGVEALVHALTSATPSGKRNSFAHHVRPDFVLIEHGDGQPLNLFSAFETPVAAPGFMDQSVERLIEKRSAYAKAYGKWWQDEKIMHVGAEGSATVDELAGFAAQAVASAGAGENQ